MQLPENVLNPFKTIRSQVLETIHLFKTLEEVRAFALTSLQQNNIKGIVSVEDDNSYDSEDWVKSKDFLLWLMADHENVPEWFHKMCVFELLKYSN